MSGKIIPELSDKTKDLAKLLRDEISDMDSAINEAALRIEVYYHPLAPQVSNSCYSTANARNGQEERHWNQIGGQRTDFGCVHLPDECHQTIDSRFQTTSKRNCFTRKGTETTITTIKTILTKNILHFYRARLQTKNFITETTDGLKDLYLQLRWLPLTQNFLCKKCLSLKSG